MITTAKLRVAVLISGRGSNLRALIEACASPAYPAKIVLVISNLADAGGLAYAKDAGIPTAIVEHRNFTSRQEFDAAMQRHLDEASAKLLCLAGFLRILSDGFVRTWEGRMINIHPSLLPAFKGTHVHERVLAAGEKTSGCTVHYVTSELDSGPPILQAEVPVFPNDTPESLAARVLEAEHVLYPLALRKVAQERIEPAGGRN
jgi:phosphoribosylglycinamide formyltransferase-1